MVVKNAWYNWIPKRMKGEVPASCNSPRLLAARPSMSRYFGAQRLSSLIHSRKNLQGHNLEVAGSNPTPAPTLADFIELAFRTPRDGICDPAVDVRFMPAGPVGADFELSRERAFGDLAVDGGPGQPGPGKDSFQTDDTVWFSHGRAASCWLFLRTAETREGRHSRTRKRVLPVTVLWRRVGGKSDGSNSDAQASAEVDAVGEGQLPAEPAA